MLQKTWYDEGIRSISGKHACFYGNLQPEEQQAALTNAECAECRTS